MLKIHHDPDRADVYLSMHPFRFDEKLRCICVFDKNLISKIFRSDRFKVIAFADHYRQIADRTKFNFDASIAALDHVPLANEGSRHRHLRGQVASVVGADSRSKLRAIENFIAGLATNTFTGGRDVDLVHDVAGPIFNKLFSLWFGLEQAELVGHMNVSQVFDMVLSLNRRKGVNDQVAAMTCAFASQETRLPTTPEIAVAMNILGNDALIGSIALSLWHTLARNAGKRLDEIDYPDNLPSTGVPYIERVAAEDVEIGGLIVSKGQRVRLMIDATAYHVSEDQADLLFGKGRHLCLGKPATLTIWSSLIKALSANSRKFTVGEIKMRTGDYAFSFPEFARVTIHD
ncbi:hypothetical protein WHT83_20005 [Aminobacter sp. P9b]|uniref:hypothetical protein n=1 Tax=Aminobacter sp. P9b TaxID=3133697 RepID=UPI0032555DFA